MDCLFCKIIGGEIPSNKVYEDDTVFAFRDIDPQAPVHILIVPKEHIASAKDINESNSAVVAHIFEVAAKIAKAEGLDDSKQLRRQCRSNGETSSFSPYGRQRIYMAGRLIYNGG